MASYLRLLIQVFFIVVFFSESGWSCRQVNITTLGEGLILGNEELLSAVNLTELRDCLNFRKIETLHIQLENGGPRWEFLVQKEASTRHGLVALTQDHKARVSLYRRKIESMDLDQVAAVIQDSEMGYWYEITPNEEGVALVSVVADAEIAPFTEPILPLMIHPMNPPSFDDSVSNSQGLFNSIRNGILEARELVDTYLPTNFFGDVNPDMKEGTYIDIMVVWTHQAECIKSHWNASCTVTHATRQNMMLSILFFLHETNTAFANSGLHLQLRLAHGQRVRYHESTFTKALKDLKSGKIPNVKERRIEHKADLVMMLIDRTADYPETGAAYNNYNHISADFMYSVVAAQFSAIWFLPAHEIGHVFGCSHDRGTVDRCHDNSKTSYGYQDPQGRFRDIMSYPIPTRHCETMDGRVRNRQERHQACPIIPYFSNNRKEGRFNGASLGGDDNDCARQIERVQDTIANFF